MSTPLPPVTVEGVSAFNQEHTCAFWNPAPETGPRSGSAFTSNYFEADDFSDHGGSQPAFDWITAL